MVQRLGDASASRGRTRFQGSRPARPRRATAGPTPSPPWSAAPASTRPGTARSPRYPLKYDATAPQATATPSREPNGNGWYNAALSVDFTGIDTTSGIGSCDPDKTYSTPDSSSAALSGGCVDRAGNASPPAAFAFKYDATAPQVSSVTPVRSADRDGWYNRPVAFAVNGMDATSGPASCPPQSYSGPDSATASFSGTCLDGAGNRGTKEFGLRYDATGPVTTARADRAPDSNGWFNQPLTVSFSGVDAVSGSDSCSAAESYTGPDSAEAVVGGVCLDQAGNVGLASLSASYDATAPRGHGRRSRPAARRERLVQPRARRRLPRAATRPRGSRAAHGRPTRDRTRREPASPAPAATTRGTPADRCRSRCDSTRRRRRSAVLRVTPGNGRAVLDVDGLAGHDARRGPPRHEARLQRDGDHVHRHRPHERRPLPLHARELRRGCELRDGGRRRDAERAARLTRRGRGRQGPAAARLVSGPEGDLLPRPALAQRTDPERLAARHVVPAPPQLDLPRTPLPAPARPVPLVRLARTSAGPHRRTSAACSARARSASASGRAGPASTASGRRCRRGRGRRAQARRP